MFINKEFVIIVVINHELIYIFIQNLPSLIGLTHMCVWIERKEFIADEGQSPLPPIPSPRQQ